MKLKEKTPREIMEEARALRKATKNGVRLLHNNGKPIILNKKRKISYTEVLRNEKGYAEHLKNRHFGI